MDDLRSTSSGVLVFTQGLAALVCFCVIPFGFMLHAANHRYLMTGQESELLIPVWLTSFQIPFDGYFVQKQTTVSDQILTGSLLVAVTQLILMIPVMFLKSLSQIKELDTYEKFSKHLSLGVFLIAGLYFFRTIAIWDLFSYHRVPPSIGTARISYEFVDVMVVSLTNLVVSLLAAQLVYVLNFLIFSRPDQNSRE